MKALSLERKEKRKKVLTIISKDISLKLYTAFSSLARYSDYPRAYHSYHRRVNSLEELHDLFSGLRFFNRKFYFHFHILILISSSWCRDGRFGSKVGQIGPQLGQIRDFFISDFSTFGSMSQIY